MNYSRIIIVLFIEAFKCHLWKRVILKIQTEFLPIYIRVRFTSKLKSQNFESVTEFVFQNTSENFLIKDLHQTTEEIFVINEILNTKTVTYRLVDLQGEAVTGSFYEQELQKNHTRNISNRKSDPS